jgi:hypothetical protein
MSQIHTRGNDVVNASLLTYLTDTGNVGGANGGTVHSVTLTGGEDAATLTLRHNGEDGDILLAVKAAINTTVQVVFACAVYSGQLHVTLAGTGEVATVETS